MMPLTNYSFFYALHNSDPKGMEVINTYINRFTLFGFVIYDKKMHWEIHKLINNDWEEFDSISGKKFLFFLVIKQNNETENYFENRTYFKPLKSLSDKAIANPVQTEQEDTAFALATFLNINPKHLPVIIVSADIKFTEWHVIPISYDNFKEKLYKLGDIASKLKPTTPTKNNDLKEKLIKRSIIDEHDLNLSPKGVNLVKELYDFLAIYETVNPSKYHRVFSKKAKKHLSDIINQYTNQINNLKDSDIVDEQTDALLENIYMRLAIIFSVKNNKKRKNIKIPNWLDDLSKTYLQTFNKISILDLEIDDYSALGLPLVKSLENEIVLTYYNWLRKVHNIPMPDFYDKLYLVGNEVQDVKFEHFDLNQKVNHVLKPL